MGAVDAEVVRVSSLCGLLRVDVGGDISAAWYEDEWTVLVVLDGRLVGCASGMCLKDDVIRRCGSK